MPKKSGDPGTLVISYLQLRKVIGGLGMALPFVLAFGGFLIFRLGVQHSISYYYWTGMRDVLVGTMFAIGFFLFSYQGYERADNIAGNLACVFAVGLALFPTIEAADAAGLPWFIGLLHLAFSAAFFATLIYFCLVLFVKTSKRGRPTTQKVMRNRIYRGCGYVMIACILATIAYYAIPAVNAALAPYSLVYWMEAIAIIAFGVSWLVKGEVILKDD